MRGCRSDLPVSAGLSQMKRSIAQPSNFPSPWWAGLSHVGRKQSRASDLPPPCGEVGLLSAHARRRPGGGQNPRALHRIGFHLCCDASPHPARLCAEAQEARRPPHEGEVNSRGGPHIELHAIALPLWGATVFLVKRFAMDDGL